ncbi:YggS family pyridoxal phosphate-dependent enzyme [soil metagenome]
MTIDVAANLAAVKARIAAAASRASREPSSVKLIAVSKTKTEAAIREAYAAGQRAFGESYAQELEEKAAALADLSAIEWHFIGHLQSNKAKLVARVAHVIHAIDHPGLARELSKRAASAGRTIVALAEVKLSREPTKHGVVPEELEELLRAIEGESALQLRGLMTMPELGELDHAKRAFATLRSLRELHGGRARLPELSMGMTADLEIAITEGATMIRVGTAIFGDR